MTEPESSTSTTSTTSTTNNTSSTPASLPTPSPNFNTKSAAHYLNVQASTLEQNRWKGTGPPFVKIGRSVRYRKADLDAYLDANVFNSTTEAQNKRV